MASKVLLVVGALAAVSWPADVASQGVTATVLSIGDGDTIRVRQAGKAVTVRLACIDAPETTQGPYGLQVRRYLQQRLPIGRSVSLAIKTTDRYGRSVAEVFSGVNINLAIVEDGQAFAYRQYLGGCDAREYLAAEDRASRRRVGVWQVPGGITRPWDFRRGRRSASIPDGTNPAWPPLSLQRDWLLCQSTGAAASGVAPLISPVDQRNMKQQGRHQLLKACGLGIG